MFVATSSDPLAERRWIQAVAPSVSNGIIYFGKFAHNVEDCEFRPPLVSLDGVVEWRYQSSQVGYVSLMKSEDLSLWKTGHCS